MGSTVMMSLLGASAGHCCDASRQSALKIKQSS